MNEWVSEWMNAQRTNETDRPGITTYKLLEDKSRFRRSAKKMSWACTRTVRSMTDSDKLFQTLGPATVKVLSPNLVLVRSQNSGADPGGVSLGSDEPPRREIFWSNSCREGAEYGEVNRLGWHENGGRGSRDRFRGVEFKTDMCI